MTLEDAKELLEQADYCLIHFVPQERVRTKLICPECVREKEAVRLSYIAEAIRLVRGEKPPIAAKPIEEVLDSWTCINFGNLPPINQRVWLVVEGFRERGNAGGKERYTMNSNPKFWRRKSEQ